MQEKILEKHRFYIGENHGGECLVLETKFLSNGDLDGIFTNQKLTLHSYSNSASFDLCGTSFTPENLRQLANELESALIRAKQKTHKAELATA